MIGGWVLLHKKLLNNPIMNDSELLHIFIYCLLRANFVDCETIWNGKKHNLKRGSFISGIHVLSNALNIKKTTLYRKMKMLQEFEIIGIKSENKYSIITIYNYDSYQTFEKEDGMKVERKRKTGGKQVDTDKEYKEDKEKSIGKYFQDSEVYSYDIFSEKWNNNEILKKYDCRHYYNLMDSWGANNKRKDWIAVARTFVNRDGKNAKLKTETNSSNLQLILERGY